MQKLLSLSSWVKKYWKLLLFVTVISVFHVSSKILAFDDELVAWVEGTENLDSLVDFLEPSDLEIAIFVPLLISFLIIRFISKYYCSRNLELKDIHLGMQNNEFEVVLQPKKSLKDKSVRGAECLLRWNHRKYGLIMPDEFIPVIETDVETMKELTEYVVSHAAEVYSKLKSAGFDVEIAVNVSATNLSDIAILKLITTALMQHNMPMDKLVIEVTETAIMKQPDPAIKVLVNLDSLGARISLDDFGTGHSSFLYLKHFPVREIKIDRTFIHELATNEHERAIVRSTIQLAHDIGARVVAEGVEDKATQKILVDLECDYAQGYYISKPMHVDEMIKWLSNNNEVHNDATMKTPVYNKNLN